MKGSLFEPIPSLQHDFAHFHHDNHDHNWVAHVQTLFRREFVCRCLLRWTHIENRGWNRHIAQCNAHTRRQIGSGIGYFRNLDASYDSVRIYFDHWIEVVPSGFELPTIFGGARLYSLDRNGR